MQVNERLLATPRASTTLLNEGKSSREHLAIDGRVKEKGCRIDAGRWEQGGFLVHALILLEHEGVASFPIFGDVLRRRQRVYSNLTSKQRVNWGRYPSNSFSYA